MLDAHDAVWEWAARHPESGGGVVLVGIFAAVGAPVRMRVQEELAEQRPEIAVTSRRISLDEAFTSLREGGWTWPISRPATRGAPGRPLGDRRPAAARPRRAPWPPAGRRDGVSIEETNGDVFLPIATVGPAGVDWWLVAPRADGSHPARGPVAADFEDVLDLCAAGRGLGMAASFAAEHYARPGVTFVPLTGVEDARTVLCWRADERRAAVRGLRRHHPTRS